LVRAEKDWVFVSDAHFTGQESEEMESFLRFLDSESHGIGHLVVLGDLFEFLFGFKQGSSPRDSSLTAEGFPFPDYLPVFRGIERLARQGVRIKYFEGNHDFSLSSFFQDWFEMEVEVYPDGCEERLGGRRSFIAHGDLSNPRQWKYRFFRRIVKNPWTYGLIQWAGPRWSRRIALGMSHKSHEIYHNRRPEGLSKAFQAFARQKFMEGFEVVILAHSHLPEKREEVVGDRKCLYVNVGDWVTHRSYLRFTPPDQFELRQFSEEGRGRPGDGGMG
jgi:UDP-2,3-diacylglucosamine hydrolase